MQTKTTAEEIEDFYVFAVGRLAEEPKLSFGHLLLEWDAIVNRDEIHAAIRESIADYEAGRHRPAEEVTQELRERFGFKR